LDQLRYGSSSILPKASLLPGTSHHFDPDWKLLVQLCHQGSSCLLLPAQLSRNWSCSSRNVSVPLCPKFSPFSGTSQHSRYVWKFLAQLRHDRSVILPTASLPVLLGTLHPFNPGWKLLAPLCHQGSHCQCLLLPAQLSRNRSCSHWRVWVPLLPKFSPFSGTSQHSRYVWKFSMQLRHDSIGIGLIDLILSGMSSPIDLG
jgi:hypothetical protein